MPELRTADDCRSFLLELDRRFTGRHALLSQSAKDYVLRRWLELDAESALLEAERLLDDGIAVDLFRVWLDLDLESAVEGWNQASPGLARFVRNSFLLSLSEKDPARAISEWQKPHGKADHSEAWDDTAPRIFRRWAQRDPHAAAENATDQEHCRAVMEEWFRANPVEASAYVRSQQEGRFSLKTLGPRILPELLQFDPAAAEEVIKSARERGLGSSAADQWTRVDPLAALRWAQSQPPDAPLARDVFIHAAGKLSTSNPEKAIEILRSLSTPAAGSDSSLGDFMIRHAYREAFASLAATERSRARELITTQPKLASGGALDGYLTFAFAHDTGVAIAECREWLANPELKDAVLSSALMAFRLGHGAGARDPAEVIAALPELASRVDSEVLSGWAKTNPTAAAEFIAQRAEGGTPVKDLKSRGVLAEIAIAEPEWTSKWLMDLPDALLQHEAAQTLVANWAAFDPDGAERWIASLPEGPLLDAAKVGLARRNEGAED